MLVVLFIIFLLIGLLDPVLVFGGAYYIGLILLYITIVGVFCTGLFYLAVVFLA